MMNCQSECLSQSVCDSEDPSHSWKFIKNKDGTYNIQNKREGLYLTVRSHPNPAWLLGVLNKDPDNFVLVPSNEFPELFYLKPKSYKNFCFDSTDGVFRPCQEEYMDHLYFFDTTVNDEFFVPNTFYSIRYRSNESRRYRCWTDTTNVDFCSYQGPDMAFKFVPQTDGTYMIINGLGEAAEVPDHPHLYKRGLRPKVVLSPPNPNNKLQRWRILRSPHYPENVIFKIPSIDYTLVHGIYANPSKNRHDIINIFSLGNACDERVVNENTWYILRNGDNYCLTLSKPENVIKLKECRYNDRFLFKFVWDKESHSYYIYNKSQGDKVLSIFVENGQIWNDRSGGFVPKKAGDAKQMWNTTTRQGHNSLSFQIYNRYFDKPKQQSQRGIWLGVGGMSILSPFWAQSVEFVNYTKGQLSSISDFTYEVLGVPRLKAPQCPSKVLYQIN